MCSVDYEPCDVWRATLRTARKQHRCSSCHGPILPGEQYEDYFFVFEGDPGHEKACAACRIGLDAFLKEHGAGPVPSGFGRALQDCIDEEDPASVLIWKPMLEALRARTKSAGERSAGG